MPRPLLVFVSPGMTFNRLTVISVAPPTKWAQRRWVCGCQCGRQTMVAHGALTTGKTKSCGCLKEQWKRCGFNKRHGLSKTRTYYRWRNMIERCTEPRSPMYRNYGGRGIGVCERWLVFEYFLADMGHPPPGKQLERVNNGGNYCPENCRWATPGEQSRNRRMTRWVILGEERLVWQDALGALGVPRSTGDSMRRKTGKTHQQIIDHFMEMRHA